VTKKFHWSEELHRIYELEQGNIPAGLDVLMKHCHYEDRDALQSALDKVLSKGEAVNTTSRIVTAIGKQRYVNHQLNATLNDEGKPIHVRGVVQDISELVTFQTEIKEKEHFIRKIAEATPDVITLFDLQKKSVLYVNHSITSLLGYSIEELMAMSFEQRLGTTIHPDDFSCIDAIYKAAAQASDQDLITQEYRMVKRDGTLCWVRNRSKVFRRNEAGEGIQVLGIIQDITEDRKIRSELSNRALFIENIMNSSIDRIYVLDAAYKILEWNQRCEQYYNLKREEVLGKSLFDLFPKLAADELITCAMEKALGGEPAYLAPMTEIYINCISERFYLPLKDDDDSIKGMLCILHDVTKMQNAKQELKDLNSTLEKKNIELECKNEEITTLAFVASHDLKNPCEKSIRLATGFSKGRRFP
jgi:PAS domain S-box-containing protein